MVQNEQPEAAHAASEADEPSRIKHTEDDGIKIPEPFTTDSLLYAVLIVAAFALAFVLF